MLVNKFLLLRYPYSSVTIVPRLKKRINARSKPTDPKEKENKLDVRDNFIVRIACINEGGSLGFVSIA